MITIAGRKYAANANEMTDSLFQPGGTCSGYHKTRKGGILLLNLQGKPFAFIADQNGSQWFVTACRIDSGKDKGRTFYMQGFADYTAKELGIDSLSWSDQHDAARDATRQIRDYEPPQTLAQRTMVITAEDPDFA